MHDVHLRRAMTRKEELKGKQWRNREGKRKYKVINNETLIKKNGKK